MRKCTLLCLAYDMEGGTSAYRSGATVLPVGEGERDSQDYPTTLNYPVTHCDCERVDLAERTQNPPSNCLESLASGEDGQASHLPHGAASRPKHALLKKDLED